MDSAGFIMDDPLLILGMLAAAGVVGWMWWGDLQAYRQGQPSPRALPGAVPCAPGAVMLAVFGALVLVGAETWGESALGLTDQQKTITVLFGLYTLAAAVIEEIVFRGFLVVSGRGRAVLVASIVGFSLIFALAHPFLWQWEDGALTFSFSAKAWFSTGAIFAGSIWFYFVRFMPSNPGRSLWPCFAAHFTKNAAVFAIKGAQGFVEGWW
jgi:membrane protease YdiL (CAAX protease family)